MAFREIFANSDIPREQEIPGTEPVDKNDRGLTNKDKDVDELRQSQEMLAETRGDHAEWPAEMDRYKEVVAFIGEKEHLDNLSGEGAHEILDDWPDGNLA